MDPHTRDRCLRKLDALAGPAEELARRDPTAAHIPAGLAELRAALWRATDHVPSEA